MNHTGCLHRPIRKIVVNLLSCETAELISTKVIMTAALRSTSKLTFLQVLYNCNTIGKLNHKNVEVDARFSNQG